MSDDDIRTAIYRSRSKCAIARTIIRELGVEIGRVRVSTQGVSIAKDGHRYYYSVPMPACKLVRDFDSGLEVEPLETFVLKYIHRRKITPVSEERKAQVNAARRAREQALRDLGREPTKYPGRYGI